MSIILSGKILHILRTFQLCRPEYKHQLQDDLSSADNVSTLVIINRKTIAFEILNLFYQLNII